MGPNSHLRLATAAAVIAAVFASIFAASFIQFEQQSFEQRSKVTSNQRSGNEPPSARDANVTPVRTMRVILASPYHQ